MNNCSMLLLSYVKDIHMVNIILCIQLTTSHASESGIIALKAGNICQ